MSNAKVGLSYYCNLEKSLANELGYCNHSCPNQLINVGFQMTRVTIVKSSLDLHSYFNYQLVIAEVSSHGSYYHTNLICIFASS
jgi:hypothetical protein